MHSLAAWRAARKPSFGRFHQASMLATEIKIRAVSISTSFSCTTTGKCPLKRRLPAVDRAWDSTNSSCIDSGIWKLNRLFSWFRV
jgi:hypothetical protein